MRWSSILGQDRVVQMLQRCIIDHRIPQALLLTGREGAGTIALALAMARTVNCHHPVTTASTVEPCEACPSCIQSSSLQHTNIKLVMALPAGKADSEEDVADDVVDALRETLQSVAEDPYTRVRLPNASMIRIGQIREVKRMLSLSAAQEGRRVVIIVNAEEMNVEASNAFLKTLEEPHDDVTIILTTSRPERLLQTIVSRCQELIVPPLADETVIAALIERGLCTAEEAALVAPFAEGDIQRASDFVSEDVRGLRTSALALLRAALRGKDYRNALADAASEIGDERSKTKAEATLSLLAVWLRDAYALALGGPDIRLVNADDRSALEKFAAAFGSADLPAVVGVLERASRDVQRNTSITLTLLTTMMDVRGIIARTRSAS